MPANQVSTETLENEATAEKQEAASLCTDFATLERAAAVREFVEKLGYIKGTTMYVAMDEAFQSMFNEPLTPE